MKKFENNKILLIQNLFTNIMLNIYTGKYLSFFASILYIYIKNIEIEIKWNNLLLCINITNNKSNQENMQLFKCQYVNIILILSHSLYKNK